jgi:hypothetical protein
MREVQETTQLAHFVEAVFIHPFGKSLSEPPERAHAVKNDLRDDLNGISSSQEPLHDVLAPVDASR